MILRELFYFDKATLDPAEDGSYEPQYDQSIIQRNDSRKTRLTLRQINRVRKASELHNSKKAEELNFVRQMYGLAAQQNAM